MAIDPTEPGLLDRIREAAEEVTRRAQWVRIDDRALDQLASLFSRERPRNPGLDPTHRAFASAETTLAYVITMNAINFGSGWFPHLAKRGKLSGYLTLSTALRERFEKQGHWRAAELERLTAADCCSVFGQSGEGPAGELMDLYAAALNQLGKFLNDEFEGRFAGPIEQARGSAERLTGILAQMPFYQDVSRYQDLDVPFYKRAQITAADLAEAFEGRGHGRFSDLDRLTLFADNLVPHTLRMLGVLVYDLKLQLPIDKETLLEAGGEAEIEIRAVGLHAVERLAATCQQRGWQVSAHRLDQLLWSRGQSPKIKATPRHRTRCTFY
jgi:hypothetical protein